MKRQSPAVSDDIFEVRRQRLAIPTTISPPGAAAGPPTCAADGASLVMPKNNYSIIFHFLRQYDARRTRRTHCQSVGMDDKADFHHNDDASDGKFVVVDN